MVVVVVVVMVTDWLAVRFNDILLLQNLFNVIILISLTSIMASNQPIMPKINSPLGILRTSQAVASDITINIILYALIYSIIYLFRLRNLFLQFNHYFITIILFILEIFWIILYIIIRLIYLVYNTINDSKINDYRYNTHGILRTFIIHNQFWKFKII